MVGWILLHRCRMMVRLLDDLDIPILMGRERTVNSAADPGQGGRVHLVSRRCRGQVSGRPVRNLTFPHSWLMEEDSRRGLVLVALEAQFLNDLEVPTLVGLEKAREVDARSDQVASGVLAGMARTLVWTLPLSTTAGRPMRSYLQHPVSGRGKSQ